MRLKTLSTIALVMGVSALVATPSSAKPGGPGSHADDKGDHGKHDQDKPDHDKHGQDKGHDDDHRDGSARDDHEGRGKGGDDDGKSAGERREFRRGLFERSEKGIVERLNHEHLMVSDEVKESIRVHWRRLARLVRIRELALAAKEDAVAKHVDEVIDREEKAFTARLDKLRDKASAAQGGAR